MSSSTRAETKTTSRRAGTDSERSARMRDKLAPAKSNQSSTRMPAAAATPTAMYSQRERNNLERPDSEARTEFSHVPIPRSAGGQRTLRRLLDMARTRDDDAADDRIGQVDAWRRRFQRARWVDAGME